MLYNFLYHKSAHKSSNLFNISRAVQNGTNLNFVPFDPPKKELLRNEIAQRVGNNDAIT